MSPAAGNLAPATSTSTAISWRPAYSFTSMSACSPPPLHEEYLVPERERAFDAFLTQSLPDSVGEVLARRTQMLWHSLRTTFRRLPLPVIELGDDDLSLEISWNRPNGFASITMSASTIEWFYREAEGKFDGGDVQEFAFPTSFMAQLAKVTGYPFKDSDFV